MLQNFRVIMKYNPAEAYALAIGHLADRLRGGGAVRAGTGRAMSACCRAPSGWNCSSCLPARLRCRRAGRPARRPDPRGDPRFPGPRSARFPTVLPPRRAGAAARAVKRWQPRGHLQVDIFGALLTHAWRAVQRPWRLGMATAHDWQRARFSQLARRRGRSGRGGVRRRRRRRTRRHAPAQAQFSRRSAIRSRRRPPASRRRLLRRSVRPRQPAYEFDDTRRAAAARRQFARAAAAQAEEARAATPTTSDRGAWATAWPTGSPMGSRTRSPMRRRSASCARTSSHSGLIRYEAKGDLDWWHVARDILAKEKAELRRHDARRQRPPEHPRAATSPKKRTKKPTRTKTRTEPKTPGADEQRRDQNKDQPDDAEQDADHRARAASAAASRRRHRIPHRAVGRALFASASTRRSPRSRARACRCSGSACRRSAARARPPTRSISTISTARAPRRPASSMSTSGTASSTRAASTSNFGPDFEGQMRRLRSGDGVYFTKSGARKLAHYVEREIRRYMSNRALPMALPSGPVEPATPGDGKPAARPLAGPVVPLTVPPADIRRTAGRRRHAARAWRRHRDAACWSRASRCRRRAGRADDFAWPRGDGKPSSRWRRAGRRAARRCAPRRPTPARRRRPASRRQAAPKSAPAAKTGAERDVKPKPQRPCAASQAAPPARRRCPTAAPVA